MRRKTTTETELDAALIHEGVRLHGAVLPVEQLNASATLPIPDVVRLLERPPSQPAAAPSSETDGCWLEWTFTSHLPRHSHPVDGCLEAFIKLSDGMPERVLRFAATWGVLGLCEHRHPYPHRHLGRRCQPLGIPSSGPAHEPRDAMAWEPVAPWKRYAGWARGILMAAARLNQDEPPNPEEWRLVEQWPFSGNDAAAEARFTEHMNLRRQEPIVARQELARAVSDWLLEAGVAPRLQWNRKANLYGITVAPLESSLWGETYGFLFPVLAVQLAAAVSSPLYRCSICHTPFPLRENKNRPRAGQRRFCSDDCAREGKRESTLRSYHRKARERRPTDSLTDSQRGTLWESTADDCGQ